MLDALSGLSCWIFFSHHGSLGVVHVTCWFAEWREFSGAGFWGRLVHEHFQVDSGGGDARSGRDCSESKVFCVEGINAP